LEEPLWETHFKLKQWNGKLNRQTYVTTTRNKELLTFGILHIRLRHHLRNRLPHCHNHRYRLHTDWVSHFLLHLLILCLFCCLKLSFGFWFHALLGLSVCRFIEPNLNHSYAFLDSLQTLEWTIRTNLFNESFQKHFSTSWLKVGVS